MIAAKFNGVTVETADFNAEKSAFGKSPVAETADGTLWGANTIARYVARQGANKLYGANAFEAVRNSNNFILLILIRLKLNNGSNTLLLTSTSLLLSGFSQS